jgi:biotin carboxylase
MEKDGMFVVEPPAEAVLSASEARLSTVVVTDPFSTGAVLAADLTTQGFQVVALYSEQLEHMENLQSLVPAGVSLSFAAVLPFNKDLTALIKSIQNLPGLEVVQVLAGAETGVELADQLSEAMGMRTNGTALSEARRNKYVMGETVRSAGLRAVKQLLASEWSAVSAFLGEWQPNPFKAIVKPMDSAGSDGVTLCLSKEAVETAFNSLIGKVNSLGLINTSVLVQEYLEGQEYVIDMVSRDGEHKVAGIWAYDRRPVNGAGFVCFGQEMLVADAEHVREIIEYQKKVVTALGIQNGPTHGEVKWCKGEPVLVEIGARCHGAEGVWQVIAQAAFGYNQVQCTIDSYFNADKFAAMPNEVNICTYAHMLFHII